MNEWIDGWNPFKRMNGSMDGCLDERARFAVADAVRLYMYACLGKKGTRERCRTGGSFMMRALGARQPARTRADKHKG